MQYNKIIYEVKEGVAVIRMNFPKNLNAIDEPMADELIDAFKQADQDPEVKVVVLKGGEKAFSAGGDVGYFYKTIQAGGKVDLSGLFARVGTIADNMKKLSKMIITSVSGAAAGAGASIAMAGDFMICAENAKIILAFVNLGLVPDTGATYLLSKTIGTTRALELAATGRPVKAQEAKELGLAYAVVPVDELEDATMKLAKKLAAGPLVAYRNIKKQVYNAGYYDYKKWLDETEASTQAECSETMDFQEGVKAFMEKRKAEFSGK